MAILQKNGSQVFGIVLGHEMTKDFYKSLISLKGNERIYSERFSKVNALNKREFRAQRQEEDCLKFSQAEGNIKVFFVNI